MRLYRFAAALLIAVLLTAAVSHAVFACELRSSHATHCDRSERPARLPFERPACCQDFATAPAVSRLGSSADFALASLTAAFTTTDVLALPAMPTESRSGQALPLLVERFAKLRLHLLFSSLIV